MTTSPETQSTIPATRVFAFDDSAIGKIKSSVNLFRGSVSLPLDLLTLPGRQGLDVKVALMYDSGVHKAVRESNVAAPTSIVGLGWSMPFDRIVVDKADSGTHVGDRWFYLSGGTANPLVRAGTSQDGLWSFEARNYEFWEILFDPNADTWTVTKEDGLVYRFGGRDDARDVNVKWGNWIGASTRTDGQQHYTSAWNLSDITNVWGHSVKYRYECESAQVGSGLSYTRASYLATITDSHGRQVTFDYASKFGADHPSLEGVVEYQAERDGPAFQPRLETRYLSGIRVATPAGTVTHVLRFSYSWFNGKVPGANGYGLMWKRCLQGVWSEGVDGVPTPGMVFDYDHTPNAPNPGALSRITYPEGGQAAFTYKRNILSIDKRAQVRNPLAGSSPRVWFGPSYTVTTFARSGGGLRVLVHTWNGRWIQRDITSGDLASARFEIDSLDVIAADEYIALSFRSTAVAEDRVYLFRRDASEFGAWSLYSGGPQRIALKSTTAPRTQVIGGNDWVMAYNRDFVRGGFAGFSYDWQSRVWSTPSVLPSPGRFGAPSGVTMQSGASYYIVAWYDETRRSAAFQLLYRGPNGAWGASAPWSNSELKIERDGDGNTLFAWTTRASFAVLTSVNEVRATEIDSSLRVFQWDEGFNVLNGASPKVEIQTSRVKDGQSVFDLFRTIGGGAFVNNNAANLRYQGGDPRVVDANWLVQDFTIPASTDSITAAAADDVAVLSESGGTRRNRLLTFDPSHGQFRFAQSITQAGEGPTASGNFYTIGDAVYVRKADGAWLPATNKLVGLGKTAVKSVRNVGNAYIAYQDSLGTRAKTHVVVVANSDTLPAVELSGSQKMYVEQTRVRAGTSLTSPRCLVTYPAAENFDSATTLTLYNMDEGPPVDMMVDRPVAYIEITDPMAEDIPFVQSYFYGPSSESQVAYNPLSGVAQYPVISVVPGIKSTQESPPQDQPYGRTDNYYSNGLAVQSQLAYPPGVEYNYQDLLNGFKLGEKRYAASGKLVSEEKNFWLVRRQNGETSQFLYGGLVRLERTDSSEDGVRTTETRTYDWTKGVVRYTEKSFTDGSGAMRVLRRDNLYGWEVPEYRDMFLARHDFKSVVRETKLVMDADGSNRTWIQGDVVTYDNFAQTEEPIPTATASWRWMQPGASPPSFDYGPGAKNPAWLRTSEVVAREPQSGDIVEANDAMGVPTSSILDTQGRNILAVFPGASVCGDEASYCGFEAYEADQGWRLGSGVSLMPGKLDRAIDAAAGRRSAKLAPTAVGAKGVIKRLRPQRPGPYLFTAWVKRPEGWSDVDGEAALIAAVEDKPASRAVFSGQLGAWIYLSLAIELETPGSSVSVGVENGNSKMACLVDQLTFAPQSSVVEIAVYDERRWLRTASLGSNGVLTRFVHDAFGEPIASTNALDQFIAANNAFRSRASNGGVFSTDYPNQEVHVDAAAGGALATFTRGDTWRMWWQQGPGDGWRAVDGQLQLEAFADEGTLTLSTAAAQGATVVAAQVVPLETLAAPLGIRFGDGLEIRWQPDEYRWELSAASGSATFRPTAFKVKRATYGGQLDAGRISAGLTEAFEHAGYSLEPTAVVTVAEDRRRWSIAQKQGVTYYLVVDGEDIDVTLLRRDWLALQGEQAWAFFVSGERIFSGSSSVGPTRPTLFFGNRVALPSLGFGGAPRARVTVVDASGKTLQEQRLVGQRCVVSERIYDGLGRLAVATKGAYVEPTPARPVLSYRSDFARFDWRSGRMTGLVSDAHPDCGGYPFTRQAYERSPLDRIVARGNPGAELAIGAHDTRFSYGASDGGVPGASPHAFATMTMTDPNGTSTVELKNHLGQVLQRVFAAGTDEASKNTTVFDAAGNARELWSPNAFAPPPNTSADDWVVRQTFDYAGNLTSVTSSDSGTSRTIYDPRGSVRFAQTAQGHVDGNFTYSKYDDLGRLTEFGYLTGAWDEGLLMDKAANAPAWPPTPKTWRKKLYYDAIKHGIGRVYKVELCNNERGDVDATQGVFYDAAGNQLRATLVLSSGSGDQDNGVEYGYNSLNEIERVTYPWVDDQRFEIGQQRDELGRLHAITAVGNPDNPLAEYTYDAESRPEAERVVVGGGVQSVRRFEYTPPGWIASNDAGGFGESLTYTEGGWAGARYFNGEVASGTYKGTVDEGGYTFRYQCNARGWVERAENAQEPAWSLGAASPLAFDANGNFSALSRGTQAARYDYNQGTQQLQRVVDPVTSKVLGAWQYDASGHAKVARRAWGAFGTDAELAFHYDPGTKLPVHIEDATSGTRLDLLYGGSQERLRKAVKTATEDYAIEYVRGLSQRPLVERSRYGSGKASAVLYIYGPLGLVAMRRDQTWYSVVRDHLGSTRQVLDAQGQAVAQYDYLTYGAIAASKTPHGDLTSYLFAGQEFDRETGLYSFGVRLFDPMAGRFLATDPARQFFSPYLYAGNNPVLYLDPTGLFSIGSLFSAIAGAIIGAAEIAIGVLIDVVTGGAAFNISEAFYRAGVSSVVYSVTHADNFSWRDYGVQMGIEAAKGAIAGPLSAAAASFSEGLSSIAAIAGLDFAAGAATGAVSSLIDAAAAGQTPGWDVAKGALSGALDGVANSDVFTAPTPLYTLSWKEQGKRMVAAVAKSEAATLTTTVGQNVAAGKPLASGLRNAVLYAALDGARTGFDAQAVGMHIRRGDEARRAYSALTAVSFA